MPLLIMDFKALTDETRFPKLAVVAIHVIKKWANNFAMPRQFISLPGVKGKSTPASKNKLRRRRYDFFDLRSSITMG
jgi:hypothetical protein